MNLRIAPLLIAWMPLVLVVGCGSGDGQFREFGDADNVENTSPPDQHEHHAEHGPNGGHLVELGGEDYHAEVVLDHDSRDLTVYLLGDDAKTAMAIGAETINMNLDIPGEPTSLVLFSTPLEGEADGSSRFVASGDVVPEAIHDEEDLHGSVVVMIDGTQYRGEIAHDHHHEGHAEGEAHGEE